jgi:hypothetical protein
MSLSYIIGAQISVHVADVGQIESSREREIRTLLQAAKAMDVNVVTTCVGYHAFGRLREAFGIQVGDKQYLASD